MPDRKPHTSAKNPGPGPITKLFGDLKVRPKLMVLHNLFFLALTCSVYFTVIPLVESRIAAARSREIFLVQQMLLSGQEIPESFRKLYRIEEATVAPPELPGKLRELLDSHPGEFQSPPGRPHRWYVRLSQPAVYRSAELPDAIYREAVFQARLALLGSLGGLYLLAVLVLELVILPRYVYAPLRLMLEADEASRRGDSEGELIPEKLIFGDEMGHIMRSRNRTLSELRRRESELRTAMKRLEEAAEDLRTKNQMLESAKKKLESQDRLVSLGLLSAGVAHELNTPLAVLQGSLEQSLENASAEQDRRRIERMLRVTRRLRGISESLLDFSRPRRQTPARVEVKPMIDEAWELVAIDEKAASVRFHNHTDCQHAVEGSPDRLGQVFVNLLRNALDAVSPGGNIVVRSQQTETPDGPAVAITVEDDGAGIPEEVISGIFEAFVSTRLDAKGTGLGLAVAEGIVHQHRGAIRAENRPEGGARLIVELPAAGTDVAPTERS